MKAATFIAAAIAALFLAGCSTREEHMTEREDGTGVFHMGRPAKK